ncbi:MAG: septum formation family protein [Propionibacteriales bacterium]|nr:septum formation family protein [Propionibacteriales bacterium]
MRPSGALAGAVVMLVALAGCSGADKPAARHTTTSPTAAPTPAAAPPEHACYDLSFAQAAEPTSTADPVPCSADHTAVTIRVGTIRPVVDGHLLAVDADSVQQQIAGRCRAQLAAHLGGDEETRRLARLTVVWFSPSLAQSDRGALWFRCDLIALAGHDQLAPLPRRTRDLLAADKVLDTYGTCGTSAPGGTHFERVICSAQHSWRARATIPLPKGTTYLAKAAGATADSACRDIDARIASDILTLKWSFEWPTRAQWDAGQRYGYCWTPDPA